MLVYWKKYEKVEKEHRKRAEKEAMEQRKLDDEFREVRMDKIAIDWVPMGLIQCTCTSKLTHFLIRHGYLFES